MPKETPFKLGYRMPAEWEKHKSTWLSWPKDPESFPPHIIKDVEKAYTKMIDTLTEGEEVNVLVDDKDTLSRIKGLVSKNKNIIFHVIKTADVWMRDYGPIFIRKKNDKALTKWKFNAWGNKYEELLYDSEAGMDVAKKTGLKIFEPGIVLEGGSIDTNGEGAFITTEECLLNRNRNSHLSKEEIEEYLRDYLGAINVIWLKSGIKGDDTDGHVDDIARFVNKNTVICMIEKDKRDDNYKVLQENLNILEKYKGKDGNKLNIAHILMPPPVYTDNRRLPASYANFYIANSAVLVPIFNSENDKEALSIIRRYFPDRNVVGIDSKALVYGFGAIHCVTRDEPL